MKKLLLLSLAAITSCAPIKKEDVQTSSSVDYFSKAVKLQVELQNSGKIKWAKVVVYSVVNASTGETDCSYCVAFTYPTDKDELWISDMEKAFNVKTYIYDPLQIAQVTENFNGRNLNTVIDADFYD
jgi:hypothetical protein